MADLASAVGAPIRKLAAVLMAVLLAGGTSAQSESSVPSPKLEVDDQWEYEIVNLWQGGLLAQQQARVVSVTGTQAVVQFVTRRPVDAEPKSSLVPIDMRSLTEINPARPTYVFLDFPLYPGKTWKFEYPNNAKTRGTDQVERWGKVVGWESVTVPAGTFRALRLEIKERRLSQVRDGVFPDYRYHTIWYAPEVKRFVRFEREARNAASQRTSYEGSLLKSVSVKASSVPGQ
jgi:hypothetical protein